MQHEVNTLLHLIGYIGIEESSQSCSFFIYELLSKEKVRPASSEGDTLLV